MLIGNLTRDPELRYTPSGTAVCTFGVATNRAWTTDSGEKKEDVEFHRIVAWNKLAELCSQLLKKGRKVFVEGRLSTRTWTGQDGIGDPPGFIFRHYPHNPPHRDGRRFPAIGQLGPLPA